MKNSSAWSLYVLFHIAVALYQSVIILNPKGYREQVSALCTDKEQAC